MNALRGGKQLSESEQFLESDVLNCFLDFEERGRLSDFERIGVINRLSLILCILMTVTDGLGAIW